MLVLRVSRLDRSHSRVEVHRDVSHRLPVAEGVLLVLDGERPDGRYDDRGAAGDHLVELLELRDLHVSLLDGHSDVGGDLHEGLVGDGGKDGGRLGRHERVGLLVDADEVGGGELSKKKEREKDEDGEIGREREGDDISDVENGHTTKRTQNKHAGNEHAGEAQATQLLSSLLSSPPLPSSPPHLLNQRLRRAVQIKQDGEPPLLPVHVGLEVGGVVAGDLDGSDSSGRGAVVVGDDEAVDGRQSALVVVSYGNDHAEELVLVGRLEADAGAGAEKERAEVESAVGGGRRDVRHVVFYGHLEEKRKGKREGRVRGRVRERRGTSQYIKRQAARVPLARNKTITNSNTSLSSPLIPSHLASLHELSLLQRRHARPLPAALHPPGVHLRPEQPHCAVAPGEGLEALEAGLPVVESCGADVHLDGGTRLELGSSPGPVCVSDGDVGLGFPELEAQLFPLCAVEVGGSWKGALLVDDSGGRGEGRAGEGEGSGGGKEEGEGGGEEEEGEGKAGRGKERERERERGERRKER